jgi:hypothetical protein
MMCVLEKLVRAVAFFGGGLAGTNCASLVRRWDRERKMIAEVKCRFPQVVIDLASAVWQGEQCEFALHDVLLEAGEERFAEHFVAGRSNHLPGEYHLCRIAYLIMTGEPMIWQ